MNGNNLREAAYLIRRNGHVQGSFHEAGGGYCALGAIRSAMQMDALSAIHYTAEAIALARVIREQYPDRVHYSGRGNETFVTVTTFNDHIDTEPEDVLAMMDKAAVQMDEAL